MLKKYVPYIVLLMAGFLFYYVKTHQRGNNTGVQNERVSTGVVTTSEPFNRNADSIIYTKHARCRMACRHISENEVKEILATGKIRSDKTEESEKGFTYALDGSTKEDKMVRIVVAPKKNNIVIVTVIDLDTNWPCDNCQ